MLKAFGVCVRTLTSDLRWAFRRLLRNSSPAAKVRKNRISRGAALECSPGRKSGEPRYNRTSPSGAKERFHTHSEVRWTQWSSR